jgi:hypothetical protein
MDPSSGAVRPVDFGIYPFATPSAIVAQGADFALSPVREAF